MRRGQAHDRHRATAAGWKLRYRHVERNARRRMTGLLKSGKARGWAAIFFGEGTVELTAARPAGNEVSIERQTSAPLPAAEEGGDAKPRLGTAGQQLRAQGDPAEHR